ncbi:uncharacterized protein LOC108683310 [Hyalella azteca]|uniref:Uncharacterized protein LOC108683310 n=2 Tax=Hyalella azteca TaxID=294128 RepID=A0A8B7PPG9_HYAAZ|nr:uncharacterized protein LOC108683310 [Hyalella azteca]
MSAQHSVSTGSSPVISCFIEGWSVLRPVGAGKFSLDDIDPSLCTHLVFLFAGLDDDRSTISLEAEYDTEGAFRQLVAIKARVPSLHVTVAIGGWTEGSEGFSKMASSRPTRKTFINSVLENLRRYKLDGLDIFWQNPAHKIQKGRPEDKRNYVTLVKELKEALRPEGFSLTVAVMSGKSVIDDGYDLPGLAEHVDFMYLLTYDYHGKWERITGLNAPLYPRSGETGLARTNNVNFTVSYVLEMGVPPEKIVLGLALFGRTFFLADRRNHRVGAAALEGDPSSGDGLLTYREICKRIESEGIVWSIAREQEQRAPYIYGGTEWIGYDDSLSLTEKIDLAKNLHLRGVSAFAISTDDFRGECLAGKYPLLRTINAEMRDYSIELNQPQRPAVVACFYQSWSVYRESLGKFKISDIDTSLCTHIIFSFVGLDESKLTIVDLDPHLLQRGVYDELRQLRTLNPSIVLTVAVGGYNEGSEKFSRMVATAENRKKFISSVLDFLLRTLLDGIDLAWMDPTFRGGKPEDRENFALLVQELSEAFAPLGYYLGVTVSGRSSFLRQGYDLSAIVKAADVVHILAYNFHGNWEGRAGHTSPLFPSDEERVQSNDAVTLNMDSALRAVLAGGVPAHKIAVSLPLFSTTFILRDPTQNYYGAPTFNTGFQGPYTKSVGYVGYNEICEMQLEQDRRQQQNQYVVRGWTIDWHEQHRVPYMYKDDKWAGFDNVTTIEERVRLALSHGVNGISVWSVDTDDFRGVCGNGKYPLLSAINRVFQENKIPDKQRPVMPSSTTERNVPTMSRPVSGCSVVATSNVSFAVFSCGALNDPAECDAGDTVPPQTVVLATCWETADMTVRGYKDHKKAEHARRSWDFEGFGNFNSDDGHRKDDVVSLGYGSPRNRLGHIIGG